VTVLSMPVSSTLRSVFDGTLAAAQGAAPITWPGGQSVSPLHVSASNVKVVYGREPGADVLRFAVGDFNHHTLMDLQFYNYFEFVGTDVTVYATFAVKEERCSWCKRLTPLTTAQRNHWFNDDKYDLRLSWPFPDPADPSHYLPLEKWIMSGRPRALFAPPSRERVQELLDALDDKTRPCYAAKFLRGHITCANCNRPRIIYGLCALLLFPPH
jgi:hypothetical protein